jgi:two-component system, chemotaxis family, chemotaxis protein CheY
MALKVMIVDDSPLMRAFIRKVVGLTGLEVGEFCEASDGEEALTSLRQHWIDLVLTDINMPRMNGEELVRRMESDDMMRTIPVIVISTDSSHSRVQKLLALGAKGYVCKPFAPEALRDEVEKVLSVSHA